MRVKEFKPMGVVRRIDELGRVVIPKEYRRVCGIEEGDAFEIYAEKGTKRILLSPCEKETD